MQTGESVSSAKASNSQSPQVSA